MERDVKTLVVGDMHCKEELVLPRVDAAVEALGAGRVVFCGDYVDEWRSNALIMRDALDFFGGWVRSRRAQGLGVDLVLGNHDAQYLLHEPGPGTHTALYDEVAEALLALGVRAAVTVGTSLVTHAGVTRAWADEFLDLSDGASADEVARQLNALLDDGVRMSLRMLATAGPGRGGYELPGPLWADQGELACAAGARPDRGPHARGVGRPVAGPHRGRPPHVLPPRLLRHAEPSSRPRAPGRRQHAARGGSLRACRRRRGAWPRAVGAIRVRLDGDVRAAVSLKEGA